MYWKLLPDAKVKSEAAGFHDMAIFKQGNSVGIVNKKLFMRCMTGN